MAPQSQSNVERLAQAGVVKAEVLSAEEIAIINDDFSEAEVIHLISAHEKLGTYPRKRKYCAWWV
ncbi:MAG TPA: hypothetical protein VF179_26300 [Thermoanaerobaculia bacterium]|nr:hypothetical protein [Thermoanaerobaculia bacterium]